MLFAALGCATTQRQAEEPRTPTVERDPDAPPAPDVEPVAEAKPAEKPKAEDELETDRDSFTPATSLVAPRRVLVESAYSFLDNRGVKETHSVPELIVRYGWSEWLELRLGWNYEVGGAGSEVSGADATSDEDPGRLAREYPLAYGVKVKASDQDGFVPRSSVIVQAFTPTGGSTGTTAATSLVATYAAGWKLPNEWRFDTAMRYGFASEKGDRFNQWAPSAVIKAPIGSRLAAHVEYFGIFNTQSEENISEQYISPGLHALVTKDLEVGFRLGWGLNEHTPRFFSNVGFGWRY
jgi:hypothetical protein